MHTQWFHNYSAVGNSLGLTALVVSIPIVFLFWALSVKRMKGHLAGLLTLILTIIVTTPDRMDHPVRGLPLQPDGGIRTVGDHQEFDLVALY